MNSVQNSRYFVVALITISLCVCCATATGDDMRRAASAVGNVGDKASSPPPPQTRTPPDGGDLNATDVQEKSKNNVVGGGCNLSSDGGGGKPCSARAHKRRWTYVASTDSCVRANCTNAANNFETRNRCMSACRCRCDRNETMMSARCVEHCKQYFEVASALVLCSVLAAIGGGFAFGVYCLKHKASFYRRLID